MPEFATNLIPLAIDFYIVSVCKLFTIRVKIIHWFNLLLVDFGTFEFLKNIVKINIT